MSRVPRIRFKGFEEDWEQRKLGEIADKVVEKNFQLQERDVFTNSAEFGIIDQKNFFDHEIVNKNNIGGYYIVSPNDFVYNPRISVTAPVGPINRNKLCKRGIMSPLYTVFHPRNMNETFLEFYFRTNKWHKFMEYNGDSGARSDRFSIKTELFYAMTIPFPSHKEQSKVGICFESLDHLITLHQRKLEKLKIIKKSMLENLFPQNGEKTPKIRFSGFTKDWEQRKLGEVANRFDSTRIPISENLRVLGNTPYYGANGIQDYIDGYTHDGEYVLIAEDGANDLKNYPIRLVKGRIWVNNHAHVIQGIEKIMNNQFINFAMSQVDFESIVVGCGRAKLNAEQLMDICFKIPNKNEQANIGRLFESLDHLITLHQSKLGKLQKIKKSMLESMFV